MLFRPLKKKVNEDFRSSGKGGISFDGGQFVRSEQSRLLIPDGKAVRVHRSKDRRLASELAQHGLEHAYTADGGKSFAQSPEASIIAAAKRGNELDLVDA